MVRERSRRKEVGLFVRLQNVGQFLVRRRLMADEGVVEQAIIHRVALSLHDRRRVARCDAVQGLAVEIAVQCKERRGRTVAARHQSPEERFPRISSVPNLSEQ